MKKFFTSLILAAMLLGCGGGGSASPPATSIHVAVYGDSHTSGGSLAVKPVELMQSTLGAPYVLRDYSLPGTRAVDALAFLPAQVTASGPAYTHPDVVVILYGGNDIRFGEDQGQFEVDLKSLTVASQQAGAKVILGNVIRHPLYEHLITHVNAAVSRVAADTGATLVDLHALPTGAFPDAIHPDQKSSDMRAMEVVKAIQRVTQ